MAVANIVAARVEILQFRNARGVGNESLHILKQRVLHIAWFSGALAASENAHDFLFNFFGWIRNKDGVAQTLAHFIFSIDAHQAAHFANLGARHWKYPAKLHVLMVLGLLIHAAIHVIEAARHLTRHF